MTCFHPIKGWRSRTLSVNGKFYFTMKPSEAYYDLRMEVPCGRCTGCRIARSASWAIRCVHEATLHEQNCFITLTYNEKYNNKTLNVRDFQLFMKRLRRHYPEIKIRFFQCGEYGETCKNCGLSKFICQSRGCNKYIKALGRPHHHACLFNIDFADKEMWAVREGIPLYRSKILEKLWTCPKTKESYGFSTIGAVTYESAAYVARYILKKYSNKNQEKVKEYYGDKKPEYVTMSRRPGIAFNWFKQFKNDVYPNDYVLTKKLNKLKPPRYYDNLFDIENPKQMRKIKSQRIQKYLEREITPEQIRESEEILNRKVLKLKRSLETC